MCLVSDLSLERVGKGLLKLLLFVSLYSCVALVSLWLAPNPYRKEKQGAPDKFR